MTLLFTCCTWHALAKLWMHTDQTLVIFDNVTAMIGVKLCHFASTTCSAFQTEELRQEVTAHPCRSLKKNVNQDGGTPPSANNAQWSGALLRKFNMNTFKNHSLGDYPDQIYHYVMTDLYSTEPVSA